jgi:hypothetical protein
VGIYGSGDSVDVLLKIQNEYFRFLNDGSDKFWLFLAGALNALLCVRPVLLVLLLDGDLTDS